MVMEKNYETIVFLASQLGLIETHTRYLFKREGEESYWIWDIEKEKLEPLVIQVK